MHVTHAIALRVKVLDTTPVLAEVHEHIHPLISR